MGSLDGDLQARGSVDSGELDDERWRDGPTVLPVTPEDGSVSPTGSATGRGETRLVAETAHPGSYGLLHDCDSVLAVGGSQG